MNILHKLKSLLFANPESKDKYSDYIEVCIERFAWKGEENPYYCIYYKTYPRQKWQRLEVNWFPRKIFGGWDFDSRLSPDQNHVLLLKKQEALEFAKNLTRDSLNKHYEDKNREWLEYINARKECIKNIELNYPQTIRVK